MGPIFRLSVRAVVVFLFLLSQVSVFADGSQFYLHDPDHLRVGVFAGTLDPTHDNHTGIVKEARAKYELDVVYIMANLASPHKPEATSYDLRKEMAMAAFETVMAARFPDARLEMAYSKWQIIPVIEELMWRYEKAQIFHILGSDSIDRYGADFEKTFGGGRNDSFVRRYNMIVNIREKGDEHKLPKSYGQVDLLPLFVNQESLSSTDIRNDATAGRRPRGVAEKVWKIMQREGLYGIQRGSHTSRCVKSTRPQK